MAARVSWAKGMLRPLEPSKSALRLVTTRSVRLASERFESFTVQPTRGDYRGQRERSMVLEIVEGSVAEVQNLARAIAAMNGQEVGAGD
jgi:hypothetical protein